MKMAISMPMSTFIDGNGILRVAGRLRNSTNLDYDRKHPILLPSGNRIAIIVLMDIHKALCHPGHNRVIAESRLKFWIINARKLIVCDFEYY